MKENNFNFSYKTALIRLLRKYAFLLAGGLLASFSSYAQPLSCMASAPVTPTVRVESLTDLVGDFVVVCTGGTPSGGPVPQTNLTLTFNTNSTSRITAANASEALLLMDEPHSAVNPNVPLLPCLDVNGACGIGGDGTGANTYNGTPGHFNVFQGRPAGANQITWSGVPVDAPGPNRTLTLRFINLRANINQIGLSGGIAPSQVTAGVQASNPSLLPLNNPQQTVAFIEQGLYRAAINGATLSQCAGANPSIAADPSKPLDSGGQNGAQFSVQFTEGFSGAWKEKNIQWHLSNSGLGPLQAPSDAAQDVLNANFLSESGFLVNGVNPSPLTPTTAFGPFLPATFAFPSSNGLQYAGTADSGTRIALSFSGVPAGVMLFVPVQVKLTIPSLGNRQSGVAVLVSTGPNGEGPFAPVSGNGSGLAPIAVGGGSGVAVYEIVYADPFNIESITIPVAAAYLANTPGLGTINAQAGLAPWSFVGTASGLGTPIPRFVPGSPISGAFTVQACAAQDLTVSMSHSGSFAQGDTGRTFTINVSNAGANSTAGTVNLNDTLPAGFTATSIFGSGWTCSLAPLGCNRADPLPGQSSYPPITLTVSVASNAPSTLTNTVVVSGGGEINTGNDIWSDTVNILAEESTTISTSPPGLRVIVDGTVYTSPQSFQFAAGSTHSISVASPQSGPSNAQYAFQNWSDSGAISHSITVPAQPTAYTATFSLQSSAGQRLGFYPVTPCRVADTRSYAGFTGPFGPPYLTALVPRDFPISQGACGIPAYAQAYSLNITALPRRPLGGLTVWPAGQPKPVVSTLNSYDQRIVANAAIVPAGANGAVSLWASDDTEVFIDVNGYFAPPDASALVFYPAPPCRVADTRGNGGLTGPFGTPSIPGGGTRTIPITSSSCGIPSTAKAFSLNMTVVPPGPLGWLTAWPTGTPKPVVSTLNAYNGSVVANAAIVPAGSNGSIDLFASDQTDAIVDINGYFAPPGGGGGLYFYAAAPCRVMDTRSFSGFPAPFGGPTIPANGSRDINIPGSACGIPASAQAYSVNMTVVPPGPLIYLTTWPSGQPQPVVSTLNSYSGTVVANAAIVPAGAGGAIRVFASNPTDLLVDVNGYFAP